MTARQTIANYESKVREYTNFTVRGIKKVCTECGPREAGSEAEHKAQQMMAKDLEDCCEEVRIEEFKVAPRAFMAWIQICIVLGFAATAAYNLGQALASMILLSSALVIAVLEFLMYKQFLDPLFPKKTSHNLIGVRKPSGEIKRRIILAGHADSAPEWRFTYYGNKLFNSSKLVLIVVISAFLSIFIGLGFSVAAVAMGEAFHPISALTTRSSVLNILGYVQIALCTPLALCWFFHNNKGFVLGANDNLSGSFTAMAVAKLLGNTNTRLENTELVVMSVGGEECGLRGTKAYCKDHAEELLDKNVETVFVALDTMTDFDFMAIYATDLTNTVKHDPAVCGMIRESAKTAGHNVPYQPLPFGASDAAAATQAGIRSSAFCAMDPTPAAYYHTRLDTPEALQPKTVEACLDIVMEMVYQFDETGLAPFEGTTIKLGA